MSFPSFVEKSSASAITSSRSSTPDQVTTTRSNTATAFGSFRKKIPTKNHSHGPVPSVERAGDERAILGGSAQEEPRTSDPDAIAGANTPSSEHLTAVPLILESSIIQEGTIPDSDDATPPQLSPSFPAQDGDERPSIIASFRATTQSAVKMGLEIVRDPSSALPPLIGAAAGLCYILKQFEQTTSNKDDVRKLTSRIEALIESISYDCDEVENQRRMSLKRKLDKPLHELDSMMHQGNTSAFFNKAEHAGAFSRFTREIDDAITDYQMALQQAIYDKLVESDEMALLDRLLYTKDASHLTGYRRRCLPGTRTELLQAIEKWISNPEALRVYWLNGMAGTGKSTIAQSVAEWTYEFWLLGASFFCSRDFRGTRELWRIFPTLAFQLACRYPDFRSYLINAIKSSPDVARHSLSDQFRKLLLGPLKSSNVKTVIIIDALDECIDNQPASAILFVLSQYIDQLPSVKFFITGRPEPQINAGFRIRSLRPYTETMILHKIESSLVDLDIATYFRIRFLELEETTNLGSSDGWPEPQDIATLVQKSSGSFIYAETTFRFITWKHKNPRKQLHLIVNSPDSSVNLSLLHVDDLYTQILRLGFVDVDSNRPEEIFEQFRTIVGSIVLLFDPLSIDDVALLLDLDPSDVLTSLLPLNSLLLIPDQNSDLIRIIHKSFPDFITDPTRCTDVNFCIDSAAHHATIALRCLALMKERLKKNICNLPCYAKNDEVKDLAARKKQYIGNALEYACQFWTAHLEKATRVRDKELIQNIIAALTEFFKHNSLPWLELLSIVGKLALAIHALQIIKQWLSALDYDTKEASDMAEDCTRFALRFFDGIQQSSQQIYRSGLPLCPTSSLIRTLYQQDSVPEVKVVHGIEREWDSCMQTIHIGKIVCAVAISQVKGMIGVGDESGRCHIFEAASGSVITVWETSGEVKSVAFSADGSLFTSGDNGGTIMVWDVQTGIRKVLFRGGTKNAAMSVAFSPKRTLLASGTMDGKVRIWDVTSEEPLKYTLEGHTESVEAICWSDDGSKVLSGSEHGLITVWDLSTGHCLHTIQVENSIHCVAWSPDGSKIGLSILRRIMIYDARTYGQLSSFEVESSRPSLDFSPEGDHLVYGSGSLVLVRNLNLDVDVSRFFGHTYDIDSVAFSPSGNAILSGGGDWLVKIWRFRSGEKGSDPEQERPIVPVTVSFAPNGKLMATATQDEQKVKLWDAITCSHIDSLYLDPEQEEQYPDLAFSPDSSLIACGYRGWMRIWEVNTRAVVSDFDRAKCYSFCFSSDGDKIAMFGDRRIQMWDVRQGKLIAELTWTQHTDDDSEICFFEDGSGIQITQSDPIILDIIPASHQSDDDENRFLPFEFLASSKKNPLLFLTRRKYASYRVADGMDWILDAKNRSVFSIPSDQRPDYSCSWDAHGTKIAWCGDKGLVFLDFAHISTDIDNDVENTD